MAGLPAPIRVVPVPAGHLYGAEVHAQATHDQPNPQPVAKPKGR